MHIIDNLQEWMEIRKQFTVDLSIGFVPTMGNLHKGHASLYTRSKEENDLTIASLFVNPKQFNKVDDFQNYPRTLDTDLNLLKELQVDYCLLPKPDDIYADNYQYQVSEASLTKKMEGEFRPGHFEGVLTVVLKLLNLVKPNKAYFGEKDYQQYLLICGMVEAFFMDIAIIACPTIREDSKLAFSSRNNRLSAEAKQLANQFAGIFHQKNKPLSLLEEELKAIQIEVEYLQEYENRRFAAVIIDSIRLIDNYPL